MDIHRMILKLIYPDRCPFCEKLIEHSELLCADCLATLHEKHTAITGGTMGYRCISSFLYDGLVRRMIIRLKFMDRTQHISRIAAIMCEDITGRFGADAFDLLTAVPMHKKDHRGRGYNQSRLLAQELSRQMNIPYLDTLIKVKRTKAQHNLNYKERKTNLKGAFKIIDNELIQGKRILLIDDVVTTGGTLGECCKNLNKGKPELICCATIATAQQSYARQAII